MCLSSLLSHFEGVGVKKANQGPTQGYMANPGPEEGGGALGIIGRLGPEKPLMATAPREEAGLQN